VFNDEWIKIRNERVNLAYQQFQLANESIAYLNSGAQGFLQAFEQSTNEVLNSTPEMKTAFLSDYIFPLIRSKWYYAQVDPNNIKALAFDIDKIKSLGDFESILISMSSPLAQKVFSQGELFSKVLDDVLSTMLNKEDGRLLSEAKIAFNDEASKRIDNSDMAKTISPVTKYLFNKSQPELFDKVKSKIMNDYETKSKPVDSVKHKTKFIIIDALKSGIGDENGIYDFVKSKIYSSSSSLSSSSFLINRNVLSLQIGHNLFLCFNIV
jgi:hypothetical protein